jgi:hypothetical protein
VATNENLRLVGFVGEDCGEAVARVPRRFLGEKEERRGRETSAGSSKARFGVTETGEGEGSG